MNQWRKPREESATCEIWWMGRAAVLGELYPMARPLPASICDGRRETQSKSAMSGLGDAVGVKLDTEAVVGGHQ